MRQVRTRIDPENVEALAAKVEELEQRLAEAQQALQRERKSSSSLKRERAILEKLIERLPVMIVVYHPELKDFRANRAVERILGYTEKDLARQDFDLLEQVFPDAAYRAEVIAFMRSRKGGWMDLTAIAKDGSQVETSWSNFLLSDETQIGIGVDIRDRKLAEQALRESNDRFRVALSATSVTVFTTDRQLRYTWIYNSPGAGRRSSSAFLGKRDDELLPPEDVAEVMAFKQSVAASGQGGRREILLMQNGEPHRYDLALEPLRNAEGKVVGLTGAAVEVTHLRRAEKDALQNQMQMEVQRRLIEHREQERMQIARDLHDGPLQEMIGIYFTLKEASKTPGAAHLPEELPVLEDSLQKLIDNLRAFCAELRPPALGPFGLEKVILSHVETFRQRHPEITCYLQLQNERDVLDEAPRMALFRVYQEALNNVARHASAGQVWVQLLVEKDFVKLEIRDDGNGFAVPEEWIDYAREGHFGLVGMQERMQSVSGSLRLVSAPGQGTCLTAAVPRKPKSA